MKLNNGLGETKYLDQYLNRVPKRKPISVLIIPDMDFATAELRMLSRAVQDAVSGAVTMEMAFGKALLPQFACPAEFFNKKNNSKEYNHKFSDVMASRKELLSSSYDVKERALRLKEKLRRKRGK